jgi:hypothetical protein
MAAGVVMIVMCMVMMVMVVMMRVIMMVRVVVIIVVVMLMGHASEFTPPTKKHPQPDSNGSHSADLFQNGYGVRGDGLILKGNR